MQFQFNSPEMQEYRQLCSKAMGSQELYDIKIKALVTYLSKEPPDSTLRRLIGSFVTSPQNPVPLHAAMIVDNVTIFSKLYLENPRNLEENLKQACLCGSKQIAEWLLAQQNATYTSEAYEYILSYVTWIKDKCHNEWAEEIIQAFEIARKPLPKPQPWANFSLFTANLKNNP